MNDEVLKTKYELEKYGYGITEYPEDVKLLVKELVNNFIRFCAQAVEHKQLFGFKNSMGYENRDRTIDPNSLDHKEIFSVKIHYELPDSSLVTSVDKELILSCKELLSKIQPLVDKTTNVLSEIGGVDFAQLFDNSTLNLRLIHYYPNSGFEVAHSHVDRGGHTYHLYESINGLESFWNNQWNPVSLSEDKMIFFPCIQAQYASKCNLKGLCHRAVSNHESNEHGRYVLVLFVEYNKLPFKYSMKKSGPIEKTFSTGLNYNLSFGELETYFEEKKPQFRKGVSALILNKSNEILLVNLTSFKPEFFAIPGGGVEQDETLENAVYREIKEELGIDKDALVLSGVCKESLQVLFKTKKITRDGIVYDGMERFFFGFYFQGDDTEIVLQDAEIKAYKWVSFDELKNYLLFDGQLEDTSRKLLELFPFLKKNT